MNVKCGQEDSVCIRCAYLQILRKYSQPACTALEPSNRASIRLSMALPLEIISRHLGSSSVFEPATAAIAAPLTFVARRQCLLHYTILQPLGRAAVPVLQQQSQADCQDLDNLC